MGCGNRDPVHDGGDTVSTAGFDAANSRRSRRAAARTVVQAREALQVLRAFDGHPATLRYPGVFDAYYETLAPRVSFPNDSLAELAFHLGVSKDTYAGRLRRALRYAQRLQEKTA